MTILINPVLEVLGEEEAMISDWEGCLSVQGKRGKVSRHRRIRYKGLNEKGESLDRIAEGWHARLVQHEYDHLEGILYPTLLENTDEFIDLETWREKYGAK